MAKFRFAQEKQITTWVRDFYEVEADSLEDAIAIIEDANTSLEELECEDERVEWVERDTDSMDELAYQENLYPTRYRVLSCEDEEEILYR